MLTRDRVWYHGHVYVVDGNLVSFRVFNGRTHVPAGLSPVGEAYVVGAKRSALAKVGVVYRVRGSRAIALRTWVGNGQGTYVVYQKYIRVGQ